MGRLYRALLVPMAFARFRGSGTLPEPLNRAKAMGTRLYHWVAIYPFDNHVTHTFWSWSLALICKLRMVIGSRIHASEAPRPNDVIIERVYCMSPSFYFIKTYHTTSKLWSWGVSPPPLQHSPQQLCPCAK